MSETMELVRQEAQPVAKRDEPDIMRMLQSVVDKGVTNENAAALEKLVGLYERMQDREASRLYSVAFNALMAEMPEVEQTKTVPNDDGTTRYTYAPFEEIDEKLRPIALRHGFTYTFREGEPKPNMVTKICVVRHISGHKEETPYSVRIGTGPPKTSDSQKDGSAHTYAKRGALCDAFNIVAKGMDNDARMEGGPVTAEQAFELERRVKETNSNVDAFLRFAGADKFSEISASRYAELDASLKKKESRGR